MGRGSGRDDPAETRALTRTRNRLRTLIAQNSAPPRAAGRVVMKRHCVLLPRFSPRLLLRLRITRARRPVYVDAFSPSHGAIVTAAGRVFGERRCWRAAARCWRWVGLDVREIPRQDANANYHHSQLAALDEATTLLKPFMSTGVSNSVVAPLDLDTECAHSLELKVIAQRLWLLFDAATAIREAAGLSPLIVVYSSEVPPRLRAPLARRLGTRVLVCSRRMSVPTTLGVGLAAAGYALRLSCRTVVWAMSKHRRRGACAGQVAMELYDPSLSEDDPTNPLGLERTLSPSQQLLLYFTSEQISWVGGRRPFLRARPSAVDATRLPVPPGLWLHALNTLLRLVWRSGSRPQGVRAQREAFKIVRKAVEIDALFGWARPAAHVHLRFPNGRASTRIDSGLVTGAARRHGVTSIGWQSRANYSRSFVYCFDCYDVEYIWGRRWKELYEPFSYTRRYETMGSPHAFERRRSQEQERQHLTVVLFTTDIERCVPSHYTFDYTLTFLRLCLRGIRSAVDRGWVNDVRVLIKVKEPQHARVLATDARVAALIQASGADVDFLEMTRHTNGGVFDVADRVLAIGFTTPGMDGLLRGIPSAFVSDFDDSMTLFNDRDVFLLRSEAAVASFVAHGRPCSEAELEELDPYHDGKAWTRIAEQLNRSGVAGTVGDPAPLSCSEVSRAS